MDKVDIKKVQSSQIMTWKKAKDMLIPEAHTFWFILRTFVGKILGNYLTTIYYAKQKKKGIGFKKRVKLYLWILLNLFLKGIDVEPYLKSSITNKEIKDE